MGGAMIPTDDTTELIERAVRGERAALERLLLDHFTPLAAHVSRRMPPSLQSLVGVEDVVQSTLTNVFQSIGQYEVRDDATFLSWMLAIADNQLRDAVRAQKRKKRGGDRIRVQDVPAEEQSREVQLLNVLIGPDHTPSRSAARREGMQAIRVALAGLPDEYRRAIELRYFDGYSLEETAILMGRTTGAVRGLVDRARRQLREALGRASHYLSEK
jgi:RNA polymerase sigma-70 factor (ECF subfamily)